MEQPRAVCGECSNYPDMNCVEHHIDEDPPYERVFQFECPNHPDEHHGSVVRGREDVYNGDAERPQDY